MGMTEQPAVKAGDVLILLRQHPVRNSRTARTADPDGGDRPSVDAGRWLCTGRGAGVDEGVDAGATGCGWREDDGPWRHYHIRWRTDVDGNDRRATYVRRIRTGRTQPARSRRTLVLGCPRLPSTARRHGRGMAYGGESGDRRSLGNAGESACRSPRASRTCRNRRCARTTGSGRRTHRSGCSAKSTGHELAGSTNCRTHTANRFAA